MNKKLLYLTAGFILGGTFGMIFAKKYKSVGKPEKYEPKPREPIEEEKNDIEEAVQPEEEESSIPEKPNVMEYAAKLREHGYKTDYTKASEAAEAHATQATGVTITAMNSNPEEEEEANDIYVIPPEEFGDDEDYKKISLTLYADDILADENDHKLSDEDAANMVGSDYREHFGEYEDDSVYVQNDILKCYFEVLADPRRYSDIEKAKPYLVEDE